MPKKRIVLVGGGSVNWSPKILKDLLLTETLAGSTFVLYDIDRTASDRIAAFAEKLDGQLNTGARFVSTDNRSSAFEGGDYFVITISTGGLDAMSVDLAIPEEYGIFHTVGDTSGPGGWARTLRNFDVFRTLAQDINRFAPDAMVLNYSNPMGTLTQILSQMCSGPVVGLCHGLFENLRFLTSFFGIEDRAQLSVRYAGLNHFFWITEAQYGDRDLLAELRERTDSEGFTDWLRDASEDSMGFRSHRELATALFRETGVMPYLGDRHTCEFFPSYITDPAVMDRFRLIRTGIDERREKVQDRRKDLDDMIAGAIPDRYRKPSRETAANIISAHVAGSPFVDVGNTQNIGQISNLPAGLVVETPVCVDGCGVSPLSFGKLPDAVLPLVEPYSRVFEQTVQACFEGSRERALRALRFDPVCSRLTGAQVWEMGSRLIEAHRSYIPFF